MDISTGTFCLSGPHIKVKAISYQGSKQLEEMVVSGTLPDLIMTTPGPGFETTIRKYESQFDLTQQIPNYRKCSTDYSRRRRL